jgi:bifunctional non-homologous end joining protein LigD
MTTHIRIGSRSIAISNPDKVLFPEAGITKTDMAGYYRDVTEAMLPHAKGRAITMHRFPDGVGKHGFIQQKRSDHFPDWIDGLEIERSGRQGGKIEHVVCNKRATLVYLADQATVTFHGWLSRAEKIANPDKLVFDLDPPSGEDFQAVITGARRVRDLMCALGLVPYLMTTGSKGLHVVAPLDAKAGFDEVRDFARALASYLAKRIRTSSRWSSARSGAADGSISISCATAGARPACCRTRCARSPARRPRRRSSGTSYRKAASVRSATPS